MKNIPSDTQFKNSRFRKILLFLIPSSLTLSLSHAVDHTWLGTAGDGDWNNELNWDGNGIPVDNNTGTGFNAGLSFPSDGSVIIIDGDINPLPTLNIPDLGGNTAPRDTPAVNVIQEGSLDLTYGGREGSIWSNAAGTRDVLIVGDGTGGSTTVNVSSSAATLDLARHASDAENNIQVNADGILNFNVATLRFGWTATGVGRDGTVTIDGGQVNVNGVLTFISDVPERLVNFTELGGTFTAQFGGDFADLAAVNARLGFDFIASIGITTEATDNGDNTFTVTAVEAEDTNLWTGNGGATWDQSTTVNFTTNEHANPLVEASFDVASAIQNRITFADEFFNSGASQAVTQTTAAISGGGVSTDFVDFTNINLDYLIDSTDSTGITGITNVNLAGTGEVTFTGTHTLTGTTFIDSDSILNLGDGTTDGSISDSTINNKGALVFTNIAVATQNAALSGAGTLEKLGAETLTFTGDSSLSGGTTVTEGTLRFEGQVGSGSHTIASGATLELFTNEELLAYNGNTTISGDGTLAITGSGGRRWATSIATFALSADALIDVREGSIRGGSNANEIWTDNLSDLNVETGATFFGVEENIRVDVITGDGTVSSGFNHPRYESFTFGVANGSGAFDGVIVDGTTTNPSTPGNYTKVGTGTQTLNGLNTYTGDTRIEDGSLIIASTSQLTFAPTQNGQNNQALGGGAGTGALVFDGQLNINLGNADTTEGNTWLLVDETALDVTYGATFSVTSSLGDFQNSGGLWVLASDDNIWNFDQNTGTLTVSSSATIFSSWAAENGLAGADAEPDADSDSDQVSNLLEFAFGTDPNSPALQELVIGQDPVEALGSPVLLINEPGFESGSALFSQRKDRDTTGSVSYAWEFSSDLLNWESSADAPSWLTTPTLIAEDASEQYDIAEVPLPATLDNGTVPQFFRVVVTLQE